MDDKRPHEKIVERALSMEYGDILTHEEAENICEMPHNSMKYYNIMGRAKRELERLGKALKSVSGVGYEVVRPDEYADIAVKKIKLGFSSMDRGRVILENAPERDMSADGLAQYRKVADRTVSLMASMRSGMKDIRRLQDGKGTFAMALEAKEAR